MKDHEVVTSVYIPEEQITEQTQLAVRTETTLFGTSDPVAIVERASQAADALASVIRKKGLFKKIGPKEHVFVEGWTLCGSMLGVFPVCVWTRPIRTEDSEENLGWEARVEARTAHGAVVGAAEAMCLRAENNWRTRDDFALRSMAQTRATSKALRMPLGFVLTLAGYSATPAEEMSQDAPAEAPDTLAAELEASVQVAKGEPITPSDLSKEAGWGDIGKHEKIEETCTCGGTMIRRLVEKGPKSGQIQYTCELSLRHYFKQPAALKLMEAVNKEMVKRAGAKATHTYYFKNEPVPEALR